MKLLDLAQLCPPVRPDTKGAEIFDRFQAEPDLMTIAVVDENDAPVGLIDRNNFTLQMGSPYGRALYAGRQISLIMDDDPLIVDEHATVADLAGEAVARRPSALLAGFIVVSKGRYAGVGTAISLLQAVTEDSRRRAEDMSRLMTVLSEAKAEAQSAHDLLREALDAMSEGVAIFDAEDRCMMWNATYAEYHRESQDVLTPGVEFSTLLHHGVQSGQYVDAIGREAAWVANRLTRRAALKTSAVEEQHLRGERYIRLEDTRLGTGGSISVAVDVTEIKRREASVRLLFENNPAPLVVFDRNTWRFLAVNEAASGLYGYSRDQFLSLSLADLITPDDQMALRAFLLSPPHQVAEINLRSWSQSTSTGQRLHVLPYIRPLDFDGTPAALAALIDITGQQEAESALKIALGGAEAANRAKSEFLANMSHEIRTPLNGVVGVASVLAGTKLTSHQNELVGIIETSAKTLQAILADILDVAKIESGKIELQSDLVFPAELVKHIGKLFSAPAADKGLQFEIHADEGAYQPVYADGVRLAQIVTNLCSNAVKFTESGQVSLSVHAIDQDNRRLVTFSISDTGIGLSDDARARLFERFVQADGSITRRFGGTGLGLAISQDLAHMMGSEIRVESVEGQGATFTLQLDLEAAVVVDQSVESEEPPLSGQVASVTDANRLRLLLVEDHPVNRKVVDLMIGELVELDMAENGAEGVSLAKAQTYDLILMDMQMPVMDGLTATRNIRAFEAANGLFRTPIIMLTANALPDHLRASHDAGADTHLSKPISVEMLLAAIDKVLSQVQPTADADGRAAQLAL